MTEAAVAVDPFQIATGVQPGPWKMLIFGQPGVGKSTFASYAPRPFFLDLENGLKRVDCAKTKKRLTSLQETLDWLRWIVKQPDYDTVVLDTVDELEKHLSAEVIAAYNRQNKPVVTVSDIPYGRGGDLLVAEWKKVIDIFDHLNAAGKNVLLTGHEQIIKFENPIEANYDFYTVNVHKKAAPVLTAKLDAVLFARYESFVKNVEEKNKSQKGKAVATGERILHTTQGVSWVAKNRFGLEATVPMDKSLFEKIN